MQTKSLNICVCVNPKKDLWIYKALESCRKQVINKKIVNYISTYRYHTLSKKYSRNIIKNRINNYLLDMDLLLIVNGDVVPSSKYIRFEIEFAISHNIPIIVSTVYGPDFFNPNLCPKLLLNKLALHVSFYGPRLGYAIEHWPADYKKLLQEKNIKPYYYPKEIFPPDPSLLDTLPEPPHQTLEQYLNEQGLTFEEYE